MKDMGRDQISHHKNFKLHPIKKTENKAKLYIVLDEFDMCDVFKFYLMLSYFQVITSG